MIRVMMQADVDSVFEKRPEIVIGFVGAIGVDNDTFTEVLGRAIDRYGYSAEVIRLTEELRSLDFDSELVPGGETDRYYRTHQDAGARFCEALDTRQAFAQLAVAKIRDRREARTGSVDRPSEATAYIVRSVKRPEEVELLRHVYGDRFYLFSAYMAREARVDALASRIAESKGLATPAAARSEAEGLVFRDEAESSHGQRSGQNVRGAFKMADFFVEAATQAELRKEIERALDLVFGHRFITPTREEFGMFLASGAARRSSDMGRQVGAAILTAGGSVIALGANEVPSFGGGAYWEGDSPDERDFQRGYDPSYRRRRQVVRDVIARLSSAGWFNDEHAKSDVDDLVRDALDGSEPVLDDALVMDVIEYGRAVHAEMLAITDAARRGVAAEGATLYSTTFPCHNCARHVVSAGIVRVMYIEPYPKSLAESLFDDSIDVDPENPDGSKVVFQPFVGVGPELYLQLFWAGERRGPSGAPNAWSATDAVPKLVRESQAFLVKERFTVQNFGEALRRAELIEAVEEDDDHGATGQVLDREADR